MGYNIYFDKKSIQINRRIIYCENKFMNEFSLYILLEYIRVVVTVELLYQAKLFRIFSPKSIYLYSLYFKINSKIYLYILY